jgi:hypothetical protein
MDSEDMNLSPLVPNKAVETLSYWPVWLCSASNMLIWAGIRQQSDSNRTQLWGSQDRPFDRFEALERFVRQEPLRRVHECVFGVLALESEPVDPRL